MLLGEKPRLGISTPVLAVLKEELWMRRYARPWLISDGLVPRRPAYALMHFLNRQANDRECYYFLISGF